VGGVPEIIDHGTNGLLVPPRDPQALGDAAALLALDPEAGRRLARAGLVRARQRFCIDRMVAEILAIYDELLPEPPPAAVPGPSRGDGTGLVRPRVLRTVAGAPRGAGPRAPVASTPGATRGAPAARSASRRRLRRWSLSESGARRRVER